MHDRLVAQGACLGSRNHWERANVFAPVGITPLIDYTWGRPGWLDWSAEEQRATRRDVTIFDQTSFSKYLVVGPGAEHALQWICSADVGGPVGRCVYTGILNRRGTYEADVTVTRLADEEFLVVSSAATTVRDLDWIRRHVPVGDQVSVVDLTSSYAVFGVMGPRSRELLTRLSPDAFDDVSFPFATSREVRLGQARVRATRITYVGELGWELYVPTELASGVYDLLFEAGDDLGVRPAGYYTIEALRLEKGYRAFGRELTSDVDPVTAGLTFACKLDSGIDFLGRDAVERVRSSGPARRLLSFVADDNPAFAWGGELVLRDGQPVGQVTSASWGASLGAVVGLALVGDRDTGRTSLGWARSGSWSIDVAGARRPISVGTRPPYDPSGLRLRPQAAG